MDRATLSRRIESILNEITRLSNTLNAMDNTNIQYDYTMQSANFSIPVSIQMCNFSMNAVLFRRFACRLAAFLAVWGRQ